MIREKILNTSNLPIGEPIKNYPEMCKLLGVKEKTGKSKQYQLEDWKRYFSYDINRWAFTIHDIYEEPIPKEPPKDNSIYVRFIEYILAYELATDEKRTDIKVIDTDMDIDDNAIAHTMRFTRTNLYKLLGLINNNYSRSNRLKIEEDVKHIPEWQLHQFYRRIDKKLRDILYKSLKSMEDRSLLTVHNIKIIIIKEIINGRVVMDYKEADNYEESLIDRVGNDVLNEMELKKKPYWDMKKLDEYYSKVNDLLQERYAEKYGWVGTFSEIKLVFTREQIRQNLEKIGEDLVLALQKSRMDKFNININVIDSVNKRAETIVAKAKDAYDAEELRLNQKFVDEGWMSEPNRYKPSKKEFPLYPDDYVTNQRILADLFVRIKEIQDGVNTSIIAELL